MARFDTLVSSMVTSIKSGTTAATLRQLHDDARRTELAWPGYTPTVPAPNGNQNLKLYELNKLAIGPNA